MSKFVKDRDKQRVETDPNKGHVPSLDPDRFWGRRPDLALVLTPPKSLSAASDTSISPPVSPRPLCVSYLAPPHDTSGSEKDLGRHDLASEAAIMLGEY
jgi:hypothetical protein